MEELNRKTVSQVLDLARQQGLPVDKTDVRNVHEDNDSAQGLPKTVRQGLRLLIRQLTSPMH